MRYLLIRRHAFISDAAFFRAIFRYLRLYDYETYATIRLFRCCCFDAATLKRVVATPRLPDSPRYADISLSMLPLLLLQRLLYVSLPRYACCAALPAAALCLFAAITLAAAFCHCHARCFSMPRHAMLDATLIR